MDWVSPESPEGLDVLRHSTAHLMAQAVQSLFPGTQVTIGPTIEDGFYYDFKRDAPFSPEELAADRKAHAGVGKGQFESRARRNAARAKPSSCFAKWARTTRSRSSKESRMTTVSLYRQGDWVDLCRGPHVPSTGGHQGI